MFFVSTIAKFMDKHKYNVSVLKKLTTESKDKLLTRSVFLAITTTTIECREV